MAQSTLMDSEFVVCNEQFFCTRVSLTVYSMQAVLKAAYQFTDRCYIHIEPETEQILLVRCKAKSVHVNAQELAHEFCNELIDQQLRVAISQETEAIRTVILAHAFSKTALIEQEFETADYTADPFEIGKQDGRA